MKHQPSPLAFAMLNRKPIWISIWSLIWSLIMVASPQVLATDTCRIRIVDSQNGWPVPMVELVTTHHVRFVSDNAGEIAMDASELMDTETWFTVRGHGYTVAKDGFGYRGVRLTPRSGETLLVQVDRQLPAKRLGRLTGGGRLAQSEQLGLIDAVDEPRLVGCDSVQSVMHGSRRFWLWGDTTLARYPLGRFGTTGAWTDATPLLAPEPPIKLDYQHFTDDQQIPRNIAELPGDGPTWLDGLASLPDQTGTPQLVARYTKIRPPLQPYEIGLCVWDSTSSNFRRHRVLWRAEDESEAAPSDPTPHGHSTLWTDQDSKSWVLFGDPFATMKCPATFEAWSDPTTWQSLSPQDAVPQDTAPTRRPASNVVPVKLPVRPHRGAVVWNEYRKKWVAIFTQLGGETSYLGELWYAEADAPTGPWVDAVHVVTHDRYTFYNPKIHIGLCDADPSVLLFEATYTHTFSATTDPTPRYDYNQILYRLDLDSIDQHDP